MIDCAVQLLIDIGLELNVAAVQRGDLFVEQEQPVHDVKWIERAQHGAERVVDGQHVCDGSTCSQRQHDLAPQGELGEDVQECLQQARVGGLVYGCRDDDSVGCRDLSRGLDDARKGNIAKKAPDLKAAAILAKLLEV